MKPTTRLIVLLLIAASCFGIYHIQEQFLVTDDGTFLKADLEARHQAAEDGDSSGPLPVIDFALLDEVRSLDLIEMELGFPEPLKSLDGRRVSLVAFMAPYDSLDDMRRCMMVPSYVGCTFCSPPSLTQVVYVSQGDDSDSSERFPFIEEPSFVSGIFRLSLPGSDHEGQGQGFVYSIENAVVTPHTGDAPQRAPGHSNTVVHTQAMTSIVPMETEELVNEVAGVVGREPLRPIEIETVSAETFETLIRARVEARYPGDDSALRSRAFSLLGMLPGDADWTSAVVNYQLSRRVAASDSSGERIHVLETIPDDHPYLRLQLVEEIARALTIQNGSHQGEILRAEKDARQLAENGDALRAREALEEGIQIVAAYRHARSRGISPFVQPPSEFAAQAEFRSFASADLSLWLSLPRETGSFFVDFLIGANGPLSGVAPALARPPTATVEIFRPRWYQDPSLWVHDPVPSNFADSLLDEPPALTDVFGIGGLIPWLRQRYGFDTATAKTLAGQWAGDRWAVWKFADDTTALLLEIRWQDVESAAQFRGAFSDMDDHVPLQQSGSRVVRLIQADSSAVLDRLTSAIGEASH